MITKGIRGAITIDNNTSNDIKNGTLELINALLDQNNIDKSQISHVFFSLTKDLNADFPARFARIDMGWEDVAMMCFNETDVDVAIKNCLRILIVVNCEENFKPHFVYLKGAKDLRK